MSNYALGDFGNKTIDLIKDINKENNRVKLYFSVHKEEIPTVEYCISIEDIDNNYIYSEIDSSIIKFYREHSDFLNRNLQRWKNGNILYEDIFSWTLGSLAFFIEKLKNSEIDLAILGTSSPHHYFNLIFDLACNYLKIPVYYLSYNFIEDRVNITKGYEGNYIELLERNKNFDILKTKKYLEKIKTDDITPDYIKKLIKNSSISFRKAIITVFKDYLKFKVLRVFKSKSIFSYKPFFGIFGFPRNNTLLEKSFIKTLKSIVAIKKLKKKYLENISYIDKKKPYIIFLAPFQPEGTSLPGAKEFSDVRIALKILYQSFGKDYNIYYKEHPTTFKYLLEGFPTYVDDHRSVKMYEELLTLGIKFIPLNISTKELIDQSEIVATINGTVAIEAIVRKKRVITFSSAWYGIIDGVNNLNYESIEDKKLEFIKLEKIKEKIEKRLFDLSRNSLPNIFSISTYGEYTEKGYLQYIEEFIKLGKISSEKGKI